LLLLIQDEAEHLSDRVAVVKEGELQCCGSPLYLKDKYNLGWNMTVVMEKPEDEEGMESSYGDVQERITGFLKHYIPQVELTRRSGRELTFCFPKGHEDLFPEMFDDFEQQAKHLGATSYGIENASFEEVFLLLAEQKGRISLQPDKDEDLSLAETRSVQTDNASLVGGSDTESIASSKITAESGDTDDDASAFASSPMVDTLEFKNGGHYKSMNPLAQIGLLYWKRVTVQKRDVKGAFFAIVVPTILVALVVLVLNANVIIAGPPQEMSPSLFVKSYSSPNVGESSTEVLVGGSAKDRVQSEYLFMDSGLSHGYPNTRFTHLKKVMSSSKISEYLIETYNDHSHPTRFGAFSIDDHVELNVNLNFTAFQNQINFYMNKAKAHDAIKLKDKRIDILEVLGLAGANGRIYWRKSVSEMATEFYSWTNMDPDVRVRTVSFVPRPLW
jgi:hypothetical protein